ncbi:MAG: MBL fold metallo-hydrolase, partial [Lachnospiraceae bacterium]|nr:MBL fold metallo-hydrolase [Lachnospiraceae bacterium]
MMIDFSCKHDILIRDEDGTLRPMDEPYFESEKVADGTWRILSDGDYSYLVEGENEAAVIDSGYGCGNLREYCQTLTDKPVKIIFNTHDHFDHTANNSYFECAYI